MKKIAFLFTVALGLGGLAFSDDMAAPAAPVVTIGDWGRQVFAFGNQDGSNGYFGGLGVSWGNAPRIVGLNINAHTDTVGFSITPEDDAGGNNFGLTDQNKAWINPIAGVTVEAGWSLETDIWRGTSDFGSDDWVRFLGYQQNSFTFFRLGEGGQDTDIYYNKDGIGAWVLVNDPNSAATTTLAESIQAGAAYTIPSIGTIKAQYVGYTVAGTTVQGTTLYNKDSNGNITSAVADGTAFGKVQAAFNLSAIQGLYEELGVVVPTSASDAGWVFQVNDALDYKIQTVTLHLLVLATDFNGNEATSGGSGFGLNGGVGADFDLGNKVTVNTDIRYSNVLGVTGGASTSGINPMTGFLVGITQGFSQGLIGIGFEFSTTTFAGGNTFGASNQGDSHWLIPVRMEEWF